MVPRLTQCDPVVQTGAHRSLAAHYFLDALDLHSRFLAHWECQPRKSSRIKSFIDLLMACECMLKSQCVMARTSIPLDQAYAEVKGLGHSIEKLSRSAECTFASPAHEQARLHFSSFGVGLRYSVDAHEYFFPVIGAQSGGRHNYSGTLGNSDWMKAAESVVVELIAWGKAEFTGEVTDEIEDILPNETNIELALRSHQGVQRKKKSAT